MALPQQGTETKPNYGLEDDYGEESVNGLTPTGDGNLKEKFEAAAEEASVNGLTPTGDGNPSRKPPQNIATAMC